jgi:asparagine synthase (glutamine-hydrolysing)
VCGIAGTLDLSPGLPPAERLVVTMTDALSHRGPDDAGLLVDAPVVLGHRRLSILDLSPAGHQPMATDDGELWITFNGEIYNFIELAEELRARGHRFRSSGDSEVLLKAYAEWGPDALNRLNGMFALAIWDRRRQLLFCARDRFGVKPFYYTVADGRFRFASEIKSLLLDPAVRRAPNDARVVDFLVHGIADHTAETMFEDVFQLPAGSFMSVTAQSGPTKPVRWYDLDAARVDGTGPTDELRDRLTSAVSLRLRSDVPVGTSLSGGMDSTSITAIASRLRTEEGGEPPESFSARCRDERLDEGALARSVAELTGSRLHDVWPDESEAVADLESILWQMDEPFHSASVYGQRRVMEVARESGMVVLLDGNGGDEALCGYHGLHYPALMADSLRRGHLIRVASEIGWRRRLHGTSFGRSLKDIVRFMGGRARPVVPSWVASDFKVSSKPRPAASLPGHHAFGLQVSPLPAWNHHADRNSMTFGLETRNPFLDYRVVELGHRLRGEDLLRNGYTKWVLRQTMREMLPREIVERRAKQGFRTDERHWMRAGLGDVMEEVFRSPSLAERPYFVRSELEKMLRSHQGGEDRTRALWRVFSVEHWLRLFIDPPKLEALAAPSTSPRSAGSAADAIVRLTSAPGAGAALTASG